jgi:hypothetical protein
MDIFRCVPVLEYVAEEAQLPPGSLELSDLQEPPDLQVTVAAGSELQVIDRSCLCSFQI